MGKRDFISLLESFFYKNSARYQIDMVFLYGSWAYGHPMEDSDIDLAIVFTPGLLGEEEKFFSITDISYLLMKELKREVNIISISQDFRHPMLYYNAVTFGVPIFVKDADRYLMLKLEAICQMEDFQIFGTEWQYIVAQNLLRR